MFPQPTFRANAVIELTKSLLEKLISAQPLFKSAKQIEWAIEILGYGLLPPQFQYIKDDRNYLEIILWIYEYILCGQVEMELDGKSLEAQNTEVSKKIS